MPSSQNQRCDCERRTGPFLRELEEELVWLVVSSNGLIHARRPCFLRCMIVVDVRWVGTLEVQVVARKAVSRDTARYLLDTSSLA